MVGEANGPWRGGVVKTRAVAVVVGLIAGGHTMADDILPKEPVEIGHQPQLFVDDYIVDNHWALDLDSQTVTRVFHPPQKHPENPLIAGEGGYNTVVWDEQAGLFRMWYQDFWLQSPKPNLKYTYGIAYAESTDGLHWTLPNLGLHEWEGSSQNNIVWRGMDGAKASAQFILDLPPDHRRGHHFVMLYAGTDGMHLVGSMDGIQWDKASDTLIAKSFWPDTQNSIIWDPRLEQYVWYTRATDRYGDRLPRTDGGATRRIARMSNAELWGPWSVNPQTILIPDAQDASNGFNFFYGMPTRYHNGIYWGSLWPFKLNTDIYSELAFSRDGIRFERLADRPRLIDLGPKGAWDSGMVFASPWIEVGDEWWFYYTGFDGPHGTMDRTPGIGLARVGKQRLVSLRGPSGGGVVCTRSLRWPGGKLIVNADAGRGDMKVRVSDERRRPIDGFDYGYCVPLTGDELAHEVAWKERGLDELEGEVIHLEFYLAEADLYCFRARKTD